MRVAHYCLPLAFCFALTGEAQIVDIKTEPLKTEVEPDKTVGEKRTNSPARPSNQIQDSSSARVPRRDLNSPRSGLPIRRGRRQVGLGASRAGYSAAPSMIGDTNGGSCGSLRQGSGDPLGIVAHPNFACSRLNIAENNSANIRNRFYISYRHFHEASEIGAFLAAPDGGDQGMLHIDRITFGLEREIGERASLEIRVPMNRQLTSSLSFFRSTSPADGSITSFVPTDEYTTELGNISLLVKHEIHRFERGLLSGGVALNIPTAPDINIYQEVVNSTFVITNPDGSTFPLTTLNNTIDALVYNELITVSPFLAFVATPFENWYVHGFIQYDEPIEDLSVAFNSTASIPSIAFPPTSISEFRSVPIQRLARFNVGIGRWFNWSGCCHADMRIALTSELHYTTTVEDAKTTQFNLLPGAPIPPAFIELGNLSNRNDVLTSVSGMILRCGKTTLTNALGVPLRDGDDRGFEYEYNVSLERAF